MVSNETHMSPNIPTQLEELVLATESEDFRPHDENEALDFKVPCGKSLELLCSCKRRGAEPKTHDKEKAKEVAPLLKERSIFLVGMMAAGKSTVGKILADALGYQFFDTDQMVETMDRISVAQIFKQKGEEALRDKETEALKKLSLQFKSVVATGGGSVLRDTNWDYMKKGVTVWLDVPVDTLARRITAIGIDSRPLLQLEGSNDAYTKAKYRLQEILKDRTKNYIKADATVSLSDIAGRRLGNGDVSNLTPATVAIEVLNKIEEVLNGDHSAAIERNS